LAQQAASWSAIPAAYVSISFQLRSSPSLARTAAMTALSRKPSTLLSTLPAKSRC
jgi:hypothetical protein